MIKSLDKQKTQALYKEKIKTDTKCLRRQFRHHTGTTCRLPPTRSSPPKISPWQIQGGELKAPFIGDYI